jgi:uncharacterized protein (TIGR01777 family)
VKIVVPGGTGQVGGVLRRALTSAGHEVVVISRSSGVRWDGRTLGDWAREIDGADVVVNLAGRSVSCRYTRENLDEMMRSRVESARVVGQAIANAAKPPRVWLQMSTATIYSHRFDAPNDEFSGVVGGNEPDVPEYWGFSVRIAQNWEAELNEAVTPHTRKVALRAAMVMSPDRGGVFDYLSWLARLGLGGAVAGGRQYVSWIHDDDFVRAVALLIKEPIAGAVNLAAPNPLPQKDFMRELRRAWGVPVGLPATRTMAEVGAFAIRSDTELLLKSRRVVPGRLQEAGFEFHFPNWRDAAQNLVERRR